MTKFILSILLIILSLKNCFALCPLEWVYGIHGRHPENAVKSGGRENEGAGNRDEYVARVFYKNKHYVIGRLENREVYIEKDGKEHKEEPTLSHCAWARTFDLVIRWQI
jgi:hypothetical protein